MTQPATTRPTGFDSRTAAERAKDEALTATESAVEYLKAYSRERPEVVAMWAFGAGFLLGWKLKPW